MTIRPLRAFLKCLASTLMKKTIVGFVLQALMLSFLFTSCKRHYNAFPDALTSYFPYQIGQTISFQNSEGEVRTYTVSQKHISEEQDCRWGMKCYYDAEMYFTATCDSLSLFGYMNASVADELYIQVDQNLESSYSLYSCNPYSEIVTSEIGDTLCLNGIRTNSIIVNKKGLVLFSDQFGTQWHLLE